VWKSRVSRKFNHFCVAFESVPLLSKWSFSWHVWSVHIKRKFTALQDLCFCCFFLGIASIVINDWWLQFYKRILELNLDLRYSIITCNRLYILVFKLSSCCSNNKLSSGYFAGVWELKTDVSEHCVCSIFNRWWSVSVTHTHSHSTHSHFNTCWRWNWHSVPKRRLLILIRRENTQKTIYQIVHWSPLSGVLTAVAWEMQLSVSYPAKDFGQDHATLRMSFIE